MHVDAAREMLRDVMMPVARTETVGLLQALGRPLSAAILAPIDVPLFDNAAMDGYAFDGAMLDADPLPPSLTLTVVGQAYAGHPLTERVGRNQCARVMTGAPMPPGTDTLIPHEYAIRATALQTSEHTGDAVPVDLAALPVVTLSTAGFRKGANRRRVGEDVRRGQLVFDAGRTLRAPDLGVLASLGIATVQVRARLRVAFFSTGDELYPLGSALPPGGLYDSNRYTLHGMLTRLGVEAIDLGVVRDDPAALAEALHRASTCADAIISSGGVSAGDADFVRDVFSAAGDIVFWKLAMRPGRPFAFGLLAPAAAQSTAGGPVPTDATGGSAAVDLIDGVASVQPSTTDAIEGTAAGIGRTIPFFGLPGNPVAVVASFYHLVRDALLAAMGAAPQAPPRVRARLTAPVRKRPGRTEFARGIAHRGRLSGSEGLAAHDAQPVTNRGLATAHDDGEWQVSLSGAQGSGVLSSMSKGNCFIILPHDSADLHEGDWVDIVFFEGLL